jgi:type I restriction enzyme S subunit
MRETVVKTEYFKDSPVGQIPQDWDVKTLRELSISGISNGFFKKPELVGSGYPLVNVFDLYQDFGIDLSIVERVNASREEQQKYSIQAGDCFFTRSSLVLSGISHCNIIRHIPEPALFECHLMRVRLDKSQVVPEFLALWCRSSWARTFLMSRAKQVTMTTISQPDIAPLPVPLPPKPEQKKIVEIHDAFDSAIAHTSSLIAKLKQMKAGLLHDLLTRGLDENGELRDAIAHPEQFKDSSLGQIPKDWGVFQLSEIVPCAEYGISVSLEDQDGIPVLRMNNLKEGEVDLTDLKKSASPKAANLLLQTSDVLFNRTNSIEHVGRTAIWRGQIEQVSFASYLVRLIPDQSKLIPEYLNIWLNLETTQLLIRCYATPGVHQVNINPTNLRKALIALPQSTFEQEAIVEKIKFHNNRIRQEEIYLKKLKLQKQGLMHDLLTGKVRVKN